MDEIKIISKRGRFKIAITEEPYFKEIRGKIFEYKYKEV